jgi:hypothetical protein
MQNAQESPTTVLDDDMAALARRRAAIALLEAHRALERAVLALHAAELEPGTLIDAMDRLSRADTHVAIVRAAL